MRRELEAICKRDEEDASAASAVEAQGRALPQLTRRRQGFFFDSAAFDIMTAAVADGKFNSPRQRSPVIRVGTVVTDTAAVRADLIPEEWTKIEQLVAQRDVLGLEMQGVGLYAAAVEYNRSTQSAVQYLMVKGVAHLADYSEGDTYNLPDENKNDNFHRYSEEVAAAYALRFICAFPWLPVGISVLGNSSDDREIVPLITGVGQSDPQLLSSTSTSSPSTRSTPSGSSFWSDSTAAPASSASFSSSLPSLTVSLPHRLITFVPRPALSNALTTALAGSAARPTFTVQQKASERAATDPTCHVAVLCGLGGVGKTQLALQHAEAGSNSYSLRWWIAAEQPDSFPLLYREFADKVAIPFDADTDFPNLLSRVNDWLSTRLTWLLVFDNVRSWGDIAAIIPPTGHSMQRIIITSRHQLWPAAFRVVPVDAMTQKEAVALLKAGTGALPGNQSQDKAIAQLVMELGGLPLALSHAAAYITQLHITVEAYLDRYMDTLLNNSKSAMPPGDTYANVVATTWNISISAVDEEAKEAHLPLPGRWLLTVCSYLEPDSIPRSLLRRWCTFRGVSVDHVDGVLDQLLAKLSNYSLLHLVSGNSVVRMHRVLASVLRYQHQHFSLLEPGERSSYPSFDALWADTLAQATVAEYRYALEQHRQDSKFGEPVLLHMERIRVLFEESDWKPSEAYFDLLDNIAKCYTELGDYVKARERWATALTLKTTHYGSRHIETAITMTSLGNAYGALGDYQKQKELQERALTIMETHFNESDQAEFGRTLNNLGNAYGALGDYQKQKELQERALTIMETHFNESDQAEFGRTLNNLGNAYGALGDIRRGRSCRSEHWPSWKLNTAHITSRLPWHYAALAMRTACSGTIRSRRSCRSEH